MADDWIEVARALVDGGGPGRPGQRFLKRAVSTAYYAVFDRAASDVADSLVGRTGDRDAWTHAYRAVDHRTAREGCERVSRSAGFPPAVVRFAVALVQLQEARHDADYNPDAAFTRGQARAFVEQAEAAVSGLRALPRRQRRPFAVFLLVGRPRR